MHSKLRGIISNNLSRQELNELILASTRIAQHIIHFRKLWQPRIGALEFYTAADLANEAVSSLFIADSSGELPLRKALLNWDKEINDEASAGYFLYKIIGKRVEQENCRKLKEADPFFGKILRSLTNLVETGKLNKTSWFGICYLIEKDTDKILQKPADPEFIDNLPGYLFQGNTSKIVKSLFDYIKSESDYFPALPINAVINKIKHTNASFLNNRLSFTTNDCFEEKLDIEIIISESLKTAFERIDNYYLKKNKIDALEAENYRKVLTELTVDMRDGGINRGLFEYLSKYTDGLSKEDFYKNHHAILDYLLRLTKKQIISRLENSDK